jgi:hypothetical protein
MTDQRARQLNARDLHAVLATIETGSPGGAAQRLRETQSAISRSIANVEHTLGVTLIELTARGIVPSRYGRRLVDMIEARRRGHATGGEDEAGPGQEDRNGRDSSQRSLRRRDVVQMAATITLTYPFSPEDRELLDKLLGNNPGDSPSASAAPPAAEPAPSAAAIATPPPPPAPPPTPPPAPVDYFPSDPGLAPFPSPENSQQIVLNGKVSGRPYLKDTLGRIHTLLIDAKGIPEYAVNGASLQWAWAGHADSPPAQLLVRQGNVYVFLASGQAQYFNASGGIYNSAVPPPFETAANAANAAVPQLPRVPPMPVAGSVVPGSRRKVEVGASRAVKTLSDAIRSAEPGDRIMLDKGTYNDTPPAITVPVLINLGGSTFDMTGKTAGLARGKGLLVPAADCIIENGTITGVAMDQPSGQLTSAIRPDSGCGYLTINNMKMTNNQCAVGQGGFPVVIALTDSDISGNGLKSNNGALTHNLYCGNECRRLTLTNVIANGSNEAHSIKYRGPELIVNGGTFASAPGKPFDIPNGATVPFKINGATILKGAGDADHGILAFAEEGGDNGLAGGTINGGSIKAFCDSPAILGIGGTITLKGVALSGNKITTRGGIVVDGI